MPDAFSVTREHVLRMLDNVLNTSSGLSPSEKTRIRTWVEHTNRTVCGASSLVSKDGAVRTLCPATGAGMSLSSIRVGTFAAAWDQMVLLAMAQRAVVHPLNPPYIIEITS